MIQHIVEDYSLDSGGIRTVVKNLHTQVKLPNIVVSPNKEAEDQGMALFNRVGPWCYSKDLKSLLFDLMEAKDSIYHIHGVWMYPQYLAVKLALKHKLPFVLSPHGMYESWLWEQSYLKKKLYFKAMVARRFSKASVLHAITQQEQDTLRDMFGKGMRIETIPNLIPTVDLPKISLKPGETEEKYILFLGRLHPVKGIDLLIKAFASLPNKKLRLKIAGPFNEYQETLSALVEELGISDKVDFLGMVLGDEKFRLYSQAHVFAAPSFSEVIGMVNLEAALMGTPVITTHRTGLYVQWQDEGGMLINPLLEEMKKALSDAAAWTTAERDERGKRLRAFVLEKYSWEKNVWLWEDLYKSLV